MVESADVATETLDEVFKGIQREEFDLASEAYWGDDTQWAYVGFRHSNAWAVVGSTDRNGLAFAPDTKGAIDLAERWFREW